MVIKMRLMGEQLLVGLVVCLYKIFALVKMAEIEVSFHGIG